RLRRVRVGALERPEVDEAEQPPSGRYVDSRQILLGSEAAGYPQQDILVLGYNYACRGNGVLRLECADHGAAVHPDSCKPLERKLQVQALVLRAEHVDLRDVRDTQQARAHALDVIAQFAVGESVCRERIDDGVGVAELVVGDGTSSALREGLAARL